MCSKLRPEVIRQASQWRRMEFLTVWKISGISDILMAAAEMRAARSLQLRVRESHTLNFPFYLSRRSSCMIGLAIWQANELGHHNLTIALQALR